MADDAKRAQKVEARLAILIKGLQARAAASRDAIVGAHDAAAKAAHELQCFRLLACNEQAAIPIRLAELQGEVARATAQEAALQTRYGELQREYQQLQSALSQS